MFQDVYSEGLMHVCLGRAVEGRFGSLSDDWDSGEGSQHCDGCQQIDLC